MSKSSVLILHPTKCTCGSKQKKQKRNRTKKYQEILHDIPFLAKPRTHHCQPTKKTTKVYPLPHDCQSLLLCIVALCFSKIVPAYKWTDRSLTKVIYKSGERLKKKIFVDDHVVTPTLDNIPGNVSIGKFLMRIRIFGFVADGVIRKNMKKPELVSLLEGLKDFFENGGNAKLLLKCNKVTSAIWKEHGEYFLFQLYPSETSSGKPTASLQRHFTLNSLVKFFINRHFPKRCYDNIWIIHAFQIQQVSVRRKSPQLRQKVETSCNCHEKVCNININIKRSTSSSDSPPSWSQILNPVQDVVQCTCDNNGEDFTSYLQHLCDSRNNLDYTKGESVATVDLNVASTSTALDGAHALVHNAAAIKTDVVPYAFNKKLAEPIKIDEPTPLNEQGVIITELSPTPLPRIASILSKISSKSDVLKISSARSLLFPESNWSNPAKSAPTSLDKESEYFYDDVQVVDFSDSNLPSFHSQLVMDLVPTDRKASEEAIGLHGQVAKFWLS